MTYDPNRFPVQIRKLMWRTHVDVAEDMGSVHVMPRINKDVSGYTDDAGARYRFTQVEYYDDEEKLHGVRTIAEIKPGDRTEIAYWLGTRPRRKGEYRQGKRPLLATRLDVHRGTGELVVGISRRRSDDLVVQSLNADSTNITAIPADHFHTIRADADSREPLVVSSYYPHPVSWKPVEVLFDPNSQGISRPDGRIVQVPENFLAAIAERPCV